MANELLEKALALIDVHAKKNGNTKCGHEGTISRIE